MFVKIKIFMFLKVVKFLLFVYSMFEEYYNWFENLIFCDLFFVKGVIELYLLYEIDVSIFFIVFFKYFICIDGIGFLCVGFEILKKCYVLWW